MIETVRVEGLDLVVSKIEFSYNQSHAFSDHYIFKNLKPGDTVVAHSVNTGWHVGTVSEDLWYKTCENGWIYCNEVDFYPFAIEQCRKVVGGME